MPSPIEEPGLKQQGTDLPKGSSAGFEAGMDLAAAAPGVDFATFEAETELASGVAFESEFGAAEADSDVEEALFGPTDHPERPRTHGMGFGPGANASPNPNESEKQFLDRYAINALESDVPEDVRNWAAARLSGA